MTAATSRLEADLEDLRNNEAVARQEGRTQEADTHLGTIFDIELTIQILQGGPRLGDTRSMTFEQVEDDMLAKCLTSGGVIEDVADTYLKLLQAINLRRSNGLA